MKIEENHLYLGDHELHQLVLRPEEEACAAFVFFHGQGDYADRYIEVFQPLVAEGLLCVVTDLPGHGRSAGRRGVVPGYDFVDELYESEMALARKMLGAGKPIGLGGHSMGGHLAFRTLLKNPGRHPFSWISSPLLKMQQSALKVAVLGNLARVMPWLTVTTGVELSDCRPDARAADDPLFEALHHSRINLGWARQLIVGLPQVASELLVRDLRTNLLITQGELDVICSAPILANLIPSMKTKPEFFLAEDGLHEPFVGPRGKILMAQVRGFIGDCLQGEVKEHEEFG